MKTPENETKLWKKKKMCTYHLQCVSLWTDSYFFKTVGLIEISSKFMQA